MEVREIKSKIRDLENLIEKIQEDCEHENVLKHSNGVLLKICKKCDKYIGYPSMDEIENWKDE